MIWHLEIPFKCRLFLWKIAKEILSIAAKFQRVASLDNLQCGLCGSDLETADHILIQCSFARVVWLGQEAHKFPNLQEWILSWSCRENLVSIARKDLLNLIVISIWLIWKSRCMQLFNHKTQSPTSIILQFFKFCYD